MLLVLQKLYSWKDVSPPKKKKIVICSPKKQRSETIILPARQTKRQDFRCETLSKENSDQKFP